MKITGFRAQPYQIKLHRPIGDANCPEGGQFMPGQALFLDTDQGVSGISFGGGALVSQIVEHVLLGEDPRGVRGLWNRMVDYVFKGGHRGEAAAAVSALDIALWDLKARLNGEPIQVSAAPDFEGARLLTGRNLFKNAGPLHEPANVTIHMVNSIAYRMCLVAEGRYDACISLAGKSDWDIAAAELILSEAGGVNTNSHGQDFAYNLPDPRHKSVISAGPALHAHVLQFLETIDRPPGARW